MNEIFLAPQGILYNTSFALNQTTADDIRARNPQLKDVKFLLPNTNRPFWLAGVRRFLFLL